MPVPFGKWRPDIFDLNSGVSSVSSGVLPGLNSKLPWPSLVPFSLALGQEVSNGILCRKTDGNVAIYVGTLTKLYLFTGATSAWTDVSIAGSYTVPDGDRWSFAQFGNQLIACIGSKVPQVLDIDAGTAATNLGGSPPAARFVKVVGDQVWLYGLTSDPTMVQWSGRNNEAFWTPGEQDSDIQVFPEGGAVLGVSSIEAGLIMQEQAIRRFAATTDRSIYNFAKIEDDRGIVAPYSLVSRGPVAYFLSEEGFFAMSAGGAVPIGLDHVDKWVFSHTDASRRSLITACADPVANRIFWAIPTRTDNTQLMNVVLCYDVNLQEWSYAETDVYCLFSAATAGTTLEDLDALGYTLDTLPYSLDSRIFKPGSPILAAANSDKKLAFFSGDAMAALVETGEFQAIPGKRAFIRGVAPLTEATSVSTQVGARETLQASRSWTAASTLTRTGNCPTRSSGRYHRVRASIPAGDDWTNIAGVEIDVVQEGMT